MEADDHKRNMSRRDFLRRVGMGAGSAMAMSVLGPLRALANDEKQSTAQSKANGLIVGWRDTGTGGLLQADTPVYEDRDFDPVYQ